MTEPFRVPAQFRYVVFQGLHKEPLECVKESDLPALCRAEVERALEEAKRSGFWANISAAGWCNTYLTNRFGFPEAAPEPCCLTQAQGGGGLAHSAECAARNRFEHIETDGIVVTPQPSEEPPCTCDDRTVGGCLKHLQSKLTHDSEGRTYRIPGDPSSGVTPSAGEREMVEIRCGAGHLIDTVPVTAGGWAVRKCPECSDGLGEIRRVPTPSAGETKPRDLSPLLNVPSRGQMERDPLAGETKCGVPTLDILGRPGPCDKVSGHLDRHSFAAAGETKRCGATDSVYCCTLPPSHRGDHAAWGPLKCLHNWPVTGNPECRKCGGAGCEWCAVGARPEGGKCEHDFLPVGFGYWRCSKCGENSPRGRNGPAGRQDSPRSGARFSNWKQCDGTLTSFCQLAEGHSGDHQWAKSHLPSCTACACEKCRNFVEEVTRKMQEIHANIEATKRLMESR